MTKIKLIFLIFLISSCSQNTIDWLTAEKNAASINTINNSINKNINTCSDNILRLLISLDDSKNNFDKILSKPGFYYYNNVEKALALALIELIRRPDLNSPQANFQFYFGDIKNLQYFHFSNKHQDGLPVIFGIDYLLKKYSKNKTIKTFAQEIDKLLPANLFVDRGWIYLKENLLRVVICLFIDKLLRFKH